jgi:hypothetical protein
MASQQKDSLLINSWSVVGNTAWVSPSSAAESDNSYATVDLNSSSNSSQALRALDFGWNIPGFANLTGFVASFERYATIADSIRDTHVYLVNGGSIIGDNKANTAEYWSDTEGTVSFGSPTDMWGTSLTRAHELNSTFGVMIACGWYNSYNQTVTPHVNHMYLTVYYEWNFGACGWSGNGGTGGDIVVPIQKIYYGTIPVTKIKYETTDIQR